MEVQVKRKDVNIMSLEFWLCVILFVLACVLFLSTWLVYAETEKLDRSYKNRREEDAENDRKRKEVFKELLIRSPQTIMSMAFYDLAQQSFFGCLDNELDKPETCRILLEMYKELELEPMSIYDAKKITRQLEDLRNVFKELYNIH